MKSYALVVLGAIAGVVVASLMFYFYFVPSTLNVMHKQSFSTNIVKATTDNPDFRQVLFTGEKSQLVVMSIPPGGDVGTETHAHTEQTLFFLSGVGEALLDDKRFMVGTGDVVVVTPGTKHNFTNIGTEPLKIYTTYAPPNHIDGRIHHTKADAEADVADEAIGE